MKLNRSAMEKKCMQQANNPNITNEKHNYFLWYNN